MKPTIDHVEMFVPDRREAAEWYRRVLGLTVLAEHEHWADDPRGPLMISSDGGATKLALFEGRPQGSRVTAGFRRVAFRVGASELVEFLGRIEELALTDHLGNPVTKDALVDHDKAYSLYFCDPYGYRLELTTYEHDQVKGKL